jgi:hypothetical protein
MATRAGWLGALAACATSACFGSARAQAAEPPIELSWSAPEGCPSRDEVLARTHRHLASASTAQSGLRAVATVTPVGAGFELTLELGGRELDAHKQLRVESCEAAARAAALLIALAFDPNASAEERATPAEPQPPTEPPPTEPPPTEPPPTEPRSVPEPSAAERATPEASAPPSRTTAARAPVAAEPEAPSAASASEPLELGFSAGAVLSADFGMLPQVPAWGLRPWLALSIERVRASAGVAFWLPGEARPERAAGRASGRAIGGELTLGFELTRARPLLVPYLLGELAQVSLQTSGISDPGSASATWGGIGVGLLAGHALVAGLHATLEPAVIIAFRAPRWRLHTSDGDVTLFPAPAATFRLSAGLLYAIP